MRRWEATKNQWTNTKAFSQNPSETVTLNELHQILPEGLLSLFKRLSQRRRIGGSLDVNEIIK